MLKPIYENIPDEIKVLPQWVLWREISRKDDPLKMTKPPYQPNGLLAKSNNPATWSPFDTVKSVSDRFDGVGFVLTRDDPFVGLDFDHCRCPAFDTLDLEIARGLNMVLLEIADHIRNLDSYTEISPSGKGIRLFLKGKLPVDRKRKGTIEAYQSGQYVTVTGHVLDGFPLIIEYRQESLDAFFRAAFGAPEKPPEQETKPRVGTPLDGWRDLLEKAFKSKSGNKIKLLWDGDHSDHQSQSEADLSLCSHLAFWLKGDKAAIDTAFRQSGLMRDKWDEKHHSGGGTYGQRTIEIAIASCKSFYCDHQTPKFTYDELVDRINSTADIGVLVKSVARDVRESGLSQAEIHNLIKAIAKKTGGTVNGLYDDTRDAVSNSGRTGKIDHLKGQWSSTWTVRPMASQR